MVNYDKVPTDHLKSDVKRYVEKGELHGDFLHALFSNDLMKTFSRADLENRGKLNEWTLFVYNEIPASCWGSEEIVENWEGLDN